MYFNGTKCTSLVFCCILSLSLGAKEVKTTPQSQGLRKPLCFIENKGQVVDPNQNPRNDVQYSLATPGMTMYVGNGQLHYQFKKVEGKPGPSARIST